MKSSYIAVASKKSLPKIRNFLQRKLRELEVEERVAHQLVLAVDEACANSIIHQHQCDGVSEIMLSIFKEGATLFIELHDQGEPFPLHEYKPAQLQDMIRDRAKGGLGIFLITKIMDQVEIKQNQEDFVYRFIKHL